MQQYKDTELLGIFSTILGVLNYTENLKQTTNDELMDEMKHQNADYMEILIEQNKEIIKMLKELSLSASNES